MIKKIYRERLLKRIIFKKKNRDQWPSLERYLSQNIFLKKEAETLCRAIESEIKVQSEHFSFLYYYLAQKDNAWGDAGHEQMQAAFIRCVLKLPETTPMTLKHQEQFEALLQKKIQEWQWDHQSVNALKKQFDDYEMKVLGMPFTFHHIQELAEILKFIGSPYQIQGGYYGLDKELILGRGEIEILDSFSVVHLRQELIRTPNVIMNLAAIIGDKTVYIRYVALNHLYQQKWVQFYHAASWHYPSAIEEDISNRIRKHALDLYQIHVISDLTDRQSEFVEDMAENIFHHELGHAIAQYEILPLEIGALAEATRIFGENIFTAILELLAEFAPLHNQVSGPMSNMAKISETDRNRALKLFYIYLSDTYFFDTPDTYMYSYSELMMLSVIPYLLPNHRVDFKALQSQASAPLSFGVAASLADALLQVMRQIKQKIQHALFHKNKKTLKFEAIQKEVNKKLKDQTKVMTPSKYMRETAYWSEMLEQVKKYSPAANEIEALLTDAKTKILTDYYHDILRLNSTPSADGNLSARDYVYKSLAQWLA